MDVTTDQLWNELGGFGRYQWKYNILCALIYCLAATQMFAPNFYAYKQDVVCAQWWQNNVTFSQQEYINVCEHNLYNTSQSRTCETEWYYDKQTVRSSLQSHFNLVCQWEILSDVSTTALMVGLFIGSFIIGFIADRFGRNKAMIISSLLCFAVIIIQPFSPNIWMFIIGRFFYGVGIAGYWAVTATLNIEINPAQYHDRSFFIQIIGWNLGALLAASIAFLIRDYFHLMLAYSLLSLLMILPAIIRFESPLWLIANNRFEEAKELLQIIAISNKGNLEKSNKLICQFVANTGHWNKKKQSISGFLMIFRHRALCSVLLSCWFCFFTCSFLYYSYSLGSASLGGNHYFNIVYMFVGDILALTILIRCAFKRRIMLIIPFIISGCFNLIGGFLYDMENALVPFLVLSIGSRLSIGVATFFVWIFVAEVFPTDVRTSTIGSCSALARCGGVLAPLVFNLKAVYAPLPFLAFAGAAFLSGFSIYFFAPETYGLTHNWQTVGQAEQMVKTLVKQSQLCGRCSKKAAGPHQGQYEEAISNQSTDDAVPDAAT